MFCFGSFRIVGLSVYVGCLAPSLASTHEMPVTPPNTWDNQNVRRLARCALGAKSILAENSCLREAKVTSECLPVGLTCWAVTCLGQAMGKGLPRVETCMCLSDSCFVSLALPQSLS